MSPTSATQNRPDSFAGSAALYGGLLLLAISLSAASWIFIQKISEYGSTQELHDLSTVATTAASSLDPQLVGLLTGSSADIGSQQLEIVRGQLRRIHSAIPNARFVYLVTLRDDNIVFLADAEPTDSPDYSPPGQIYTEAPEAFRHAFSSPIPLAHGIYHDRWGDWITGISAVHLPSGGPTRAVLGVDVSAHDYLLGVADYRHFAIAIVGLFFTNVVLFTIVFIMMRRFNRRLRNDLTRLHEAQARLKLDAAVIESSAEGVMVTDAHLNIETINPAFERITGYSAHEAIGRTPKILYSGKHDDAFFRQLHESVNSNGHWHGEIWNRRKNGEIYPQQTSISVLRDDENRITHYASVFSDNTEPHRLEEQLRELSSIDGLTRIANRRTFDAALAREWARAMREQKPLSMLMADIDYFKKYNDAYGHVEGDRCLQLVAQAIQDAVNRATDLTARFGGEEFAVILPGVDAAAATAMGEKIRGNVAGLAVPHRGSDAAAFVTISVGASTIIPQQQSRQVNLIVAADHALYQAKHAGRNRVCFASGLDADAQTTSRDAATAPADPLEPVNT